LNALDDNPDLSPSEFLARQAAGERWQLLDVREPWEISLASVDAAVCIPMGEIAARLPELDPTLPVAVLCHSGIRSAQVAAALRATGFRRVANVTGGIDAWSLTVDPAIPRY